MKPFHLRVGQYEIRPLDKAGANEYDYEIIHWHKAKVTAGEVESEYPIGVLRNRIDKPQVFDFGIESYGTRLFDTGVDILLIRDMLKTTMDYLMQQWDDV